MTEGAANFLQSFGEILCKAEQGIFASKEIAFALPLHRLPPATIGGIADEKNCHAGAAGLFLCCFV